MTAKLNTYNPFLKKSLGFLIYPKSGTSSEEFFTDVNLFWQPLQDPRVFIPFVVIYFLLLLVGSFVHYHLWKMLKREENLLSHILKAYIIVQVVCWPCAITFISANYFFYPLSKATGAWFCVFNSFLLCPGIIFISFHTTIIAIMRYTFIVHDEKVCSFGKEHTKSAFHWTLGVVPIVLTIWLYFGAINRDIDARTAINKCNGSYDNVFHLSSWFDEPQNIWIAKCQAKENGEGPALFIEVINSIQCNASRAVFVLLLSNIFDCFVYYRTWSHIIKG